MRSCKLRWHDGVVVEEGIGNGENQQPCQWYKLFIYIDSATIIVGGVDESVCYRCAHLPQPRVAELWKWQSLAATNLAESDEEGSDDEGAWLRAMANGKKPM